MENPEMKTYKRALQPINTNEEPIVVPPSTSNSSDDSAETEDVNSSSTAVELTMLEKLSPKNEPPRALRCEGEAGEIVQSTDTPKTFRRSETLEKSQLKQVVMETNAQTPCETVITKTLNGHTEERNLVPVQFEDSKNVAQESTQVCRPGPKPGSSRELASKAAIVNTPERGKGTIETGCHGKKTELETEMELYEAFERDEQARLLRLDQREQEKEEKNAVKEAVNDKKRAPDAPLQERQKKQSKRVLSVVDEKIRDEEDVCFICFDGGDLVLCDRRVHNVHGIGVTICEDCMLHYQSPIESCPKAYHLGCIDRDRAFFKKKGAWFCGWHFCSICTKSGNYQCYTCPTAYCGNCVGEAEFRILRKRKGLCEECLPIVSMIERNETVNSDGVEVNFEDKETYEYLFKDYWVELRQSLSITISQLDKDGMAADGTDAEVSDTDDPSDNESYTESEKDVGETDAKEEGAEILRARRRLGRRRKGAHVDSHESPEGDMEPGNTEEEVLDQHKHEHDPHRSRSCTIEGWASKELKEFIEYMKEDASKPLTRFAVHKLLWMYIKQHKLQNPRKMSEILCDAHLQPIFEKKSVGQFEMFKLLNKHFPSKASVAPIKSCKEANSSHEHAVGGDDPAVVDGADEKIRQSPVKFKRKGRKIHEEKFERPDSKEYAAITHDNISQIYLRRALLEELLDDPEFSSKIVDTFVRIRVPGNSKTEMCYRLVLVTGTGEQKDSYKAGGKATNVALEILNLQRKESIPIELVSNQDFTEEECQRLRLNIRCGFIKTFTVGQLEEKAIVLHKAKVNDWFENERQRLVNLRDRASEKGRKKELRECVEKLQELNNPAFRVAKLQARPQIRADPRMDPGYESDVGDGDPTPDGLSSPAKNPPHSTWNKGSVGETSRWGGNYMEDTKQSGWKGGWDNHRWHNHGEDNNRRSDCGRGPYEGSRFTDKPTLGLDLNVRVEEEKPHWCDEREGRRNWDETFRGGQEHDRNQGDVHRWKGNGRGSGNPWVVENTNSMVAGDEHRIGVIPILDQQKPEWVGTKRELAVPFSTSSAVSDVVTPLPAPDQPALDAMEKERLWHYMDPTGTTQGPFTMAQLRKWKATGLFPVDLKIWKHDQGREISVLLTDALDGRFPTERDPWLVNSNITVPDPGVIPLGGHGAEDAGRRDITRQGDPNRMIDLDMIDLNVVDHSGSGWGSTPTNFGSSQSTTGRTDEWDAPMPPCEDDPWGSLCMGGESSVWGGHDAGRSSWAHRPSVPWNDAPAGIRPSRGPSASRKDTPCKFHMQGFCRKGEACSYWHK